MKDYLRELTLSAPDNLHRRCLIREYLQARILGFLQSGLAFQRWAFLGGTALRFLFHLPRFSEDLDFSLVSGPYSHDEFRHILERTKHGFENEDYRARVKTGKEKTVFTAFFFFPGLVWELGCSPHKEETLTIKIELDTNPPAGAVIITTLMRKYELLNLMHYDRASLLAGKLHAVLARPWTKGRDLFDLVWYLSDPDWPEPNIPLLQAALLQTHWRGTLPEAQTWREIMIARLRKVDFGRARRDVRPFLERTGEEKYLSLDHCLGLLGKA